jgi:hypothetical protein
MKEISKKELMNQILESQIEMGEMADYNPGREDKNPWEETPEERVARGLPPQYFQKKSKVTPFHFERPAADQPKEEKTAPDMFVYDDPDNEGKKLVVVQKPGETLLTEEELAATEPKFHQWVQAQGKMLILDVKNKIMHDPLEVSKASPSKAALGYRQKLGLNFAEKEATRETKPKELILRKLLNPAINNLAESVNKHLLDSGLPPIATPDRVYKTQKANIDRFSTIENQNVSFETHNIYLYETKADYIQNAKDKYFNFVGRNRPITSTPRLTHAVRKYNPGRNYSETRKTEKTSASYKADPLTPKLGLEKQAYSVVDYDVEILEVLNVKGGLTQAGEENRSAYKWTIQFKTEYGNKLREESGIRGGLVENRFLVAEATTGPLSKLEGSDGTIATNEQIVEAFNSAISDIQAQILSEINPEDELRNRFAAAGRTEAFRDVNESIDVDTIVNKIINELKQ